MQPDIPGLLAEYPLAAAALTVIMILAVHYQRGLTWTEYRTIHRLKVALFPVLDRRVWDGFVNQKARRGADAEYLTTVDAPLREVASRLRDGGGSWHLLCSIKRRPAADGSAAQTEYSALHLVWTHDDGTQTEAYAFRNADGSVDVYAHHETSVTGPGGHLSDPQHDGDPYGVARRGLKPDAN